LQVMERDRPDVIVSDIGMPDMDGFEFMQRVRSLAPERGGTTPAIALTAFTRVEDRHRALASGFNGFMSKPFEPAALLSSVAAAAANRMPLSAQGRQ